MTPEQIDESTELWVRLVDNLDFHAGKWYVPDEKGDWKLLSGVYLHDLLYDLGVGDPPAFEKVFVDGEWVSKLVEDAERLEIIRQFVYRDQESHARLTDDVRRAQLRFGF